MSKYVNGGGRKPAPWARYVWGTWAWLWFAACVLNTLMWYGADTFDTARFYADRCAIDMACAVAFWALARSFR